MLKEALQLRKISLVILGNFNPAIIQPFWLANKKLIREQEAQDAKVEIIHDQIVKFNIDWVTIEVTPERFILATDKEPYFEPLKDLAIGIFQILKETPVKAIGINHIMYCRVSDEDKYFQIGNKLAPLSNWNNFLQTPKLSKLEILENHREDKNEGYLRVTIQSVDGNVISSKYAITISLNDHISLVKGNQFGSKVVNTINETWQQSSDRALSIATSLWDNIEK